MNDEAISPMYSNDVIFYDELMGEKIYFVYIMTNLHNTALYIGITNNLTRRVQQHKKGEGGQFSQRYKIKKLIYYEVYGDVRTAIAERSRSREDRGLIKRN